MKIAFDLIKSIPKVSTKQIFWKRNIWCMQGSSKKLQFFFLLIKAQTSFLFVLSFDTLMYIINLHLWSSNTLKETNHFQSMFGSLKTICKAQRFNNIATLNYSISKASKIDYGSIYTWIHIIFITLRLTNLFAQRNNKVS